MEEEKELLGYSSKWAPVYKSEDGKMAVTEDNQPYDEHIYIPYDDLDVFDIGTYEQILQNSQKQDEPLEQ